MIRSNWVREISTGLMYLALIDLGIVMVTMMAIMAGDTGIQHVPFWDAQIKFFVGLIS